MGNDFSIVTKLQEGKIMTQTQFSFSMSQCWVKSVLERSGSEQRKETTGSRLINFLMSKTEEKPIGRDSKAQLKL